MIPAVLLRAPHRDAYTNIRPTRNSGNEWLDFATVPMIEDDYANTSRDSPTSLARFANASRRGGPCHIGRRGILAGLVRFASGAVTDFSQAAVPGATVEAVNLGTRIVRQVYTNEAGIYYFNDLQPGTYRVTVPASPSEQ